MQGFYRLWMLCGVARFVVGQGMVAVLFALMFLLEEEIKWQGHSETAVGLEGFYTVVYFLICRCLFLKVNS